MSIPTISVPANLADKVRAYGNFDNLKSSQIKSVLDSFVNLIVEEVSHGETVVLPKAMKFHREMLKERTFTHIKNRDQSTTKPARYAFKITPASALKVAFEALEVRDDDEEVDEEHESHDDAAVEDEDEIKPVKVKQPKEKAIKQPKEKAIKEPKPAKKAKASKKATTPPASDAEVVDSEIEETEKPAKAPKTPKEPKAKKPKPPAKTPKTKKSDSDSEITTAPDSDDAPGPSTKKAKSAPKKGGKKTAERVPELVEEPYDDVGDLTDTN